MSMTPGPWEADKVFLGNNQTVYNIEHIDRTSGTPMCLYVARNVKTKANAHAIAAVPEMVKWIEAMRKAIIDGDSEAISILLTLGAYLLRRIEGEEGTK